MELFEVGQTVYDNRPPHFVFSVGDNYYQGRIMNVLTTARRLPVRYSIDFVEKDRVTGETIT